MSIVCSHSMLKPFASMEFLQRKMENLASTRADIVVTGNPGCHLQLQYGIRKFGLKMEVMHPVSLLRRSYKQGSDLPAGRS